MILSVSPQEELKGRKLAAGERATRRLLPMVCFHQKNPTLFRGYHGNSGDGSSRLVVLGTHAGSERARSLMN